MLTIQMIKYTLYVIIYLAICTFFIKVKYQFNLSNKLSWANKNNTIPKTDLMSFLRPHTSFKSLETIDTKEIESILQQVSKTCEKYNYTVAPIKKHFLYNRQHKSLFCWIRKVASTSFTKIFSDMKNRGIKNNYYREVDVLSPQSSEELIKLTNNEDIFKLLIVRHPFVRLVSSYRDRIEDNTKYTAQAWIFVPKIFHLTRPNLFLSNGNYLRKMFDSNKKLKLIPSFEEFIEWILQRNLINDDDHWNQYYKHCAVCNINYSVILKLEDYTVEKIRYIFTKMKLNDNVGYPKLQETRNGMTNFDVTCGYFQNLTYNQIFKLYQKYQVDFEMFNYSPDNYLGCSRKTY